jgi:hypothetical protein
MVQLVLDYPYHLNQEEKLQIKISYNTLFRFSETSRTYQCLMLLDTLLLNESYANGGNAIPS